MIVLKIIKMKYFPQLSLKQLFNDRTIATFLLVLFCILFVPIEQSGISTVKVVVMALCPLIFILKKPYISKALLLGMGYWLVVYFLSLFKGEIRFSTLGFLAMYLIMFITYYDFIIKGTFTLNYFHCLWDSADITAVLPTDRYPQYAHYQPTKPVFLEYNQASFSHLGTKSFSAYLNSSHAGIFKM